MTKIEAFFPLSPMQEGMLFHTLYSPEAGEYFKCVSCVLEGRLNVAAFKAAWELVIERHSALRASFLWEGVERPIQVVHSAVSIPWEELDWRHLPSGEQRLELQRFLQRDSEQTFNLNRPPLMRFALMQTGDETHRFVWSFHHLLLDGWSIPLILKEVFATHDAEGRIEDLHLETPRPYKDYIAWLQRQDLAAAERFWKQYLKGFTAPIDLRLGHKASSGEFATYSSLRSSIPASTTAQLLSFARLARVTLSSLARAAWALLLSRYAGETDIVFGATVSGRPLELAGVESMVGLFINTLPIRVNVENDELLSEFLMMLQVQQADLSEYEHTSLADIQKWSDAQRGQPLFESILVFENYPGMDFIQERDKSICIKDVESVERTSYPLSLLVSFGKEVQISLHYDARRFDGDAMARLMEHFKTLLEAMTSNQPIHALPMVRPPERYTLTQKWNDTRAEYPELPIYRLLEDRVIEIPDRVAVAYEEGQLTYTELNRLANQLAHYLRRRGVRPGSLVGICVERSLEMVIGLLGIMKAGGAYVPFDPGYPKDRLAFMLKDAQAPLVLTQQHLLSVLPEHGTQAVCLDRNWGEIADCTGENSEHEATLEDLAYVIYTSGSTGVPKGAMNTHRGLCNRLWWMQQRYRLESDDRILQKTPFTFDVSVWEFFWPLLAGASLILARPGGHQDPSYLVKIIRSQRITTLHFVPSMLKVFLQEPGVEQCHSLRRVICSGEALSHELEQQFLARQRAELHNLYGPTEASIDVTSWQCIRGDTSPTVPIGRPIANTQIYILDRSMNVAPIGVAGELYIGGVGVGRGYWNRPELTKERFIPDPFSKDPAARLYRTGDLARYRASGAIEFLGRMDHQIKIRGLRVELGEIESTLLLHPRVREAVVVAREYEANDLRLVAYYVSSEGPIPAEQLREHARLRLPDYMVPAAFVWLDSIPLSANGKLDRRALPEPDFAESPDAGLAPPRTPTEDLISTILMDVLKIEQVGIHDNFFELGGHSLLAMQVASRVAQTFGVDIPLRTILGSPTVANLSRTVDAARTGGDGVRIESIQPLPHDSPLPLSFAQQRLWFLHQMEPNLATYILPIAVRLLGDLQLDMLTRSLKEIVSRHASLRTKFTAIEGTPMQCIEAEVSFEVRVLDLTASPEAVRESEALRLVVQDAEWPFDLAQELPIRASVLRLSEKNHILLVSMHHIISDDWSIGVFLREISALYHAYLAGQPSPLPPLSIEYADFGRWQRDSFKGDVLEKKLAYWKEKLAGPLPVLDIPTDRPRPAVQSFRGASERFCLHAPIVASLKALSLKESATLFMALLTSLECLLHRYSRQKDIIVGSPVAGRARIETENLIGFFVNTLPLRCDLSGDPSFRELLNRVREITLEAYAHDDLPFEILVDEVQPDRDLSRTPIYQIMLAPQSNSLKDLKLGNVEVTPLEIESRISKFDLTFYVWEDRGEVHGRAEYNTDLWDAASIKRLVVHFQCLLQAALATPDVPISQLPMLSEEERCRMLVEWNDTRSDHAKADCVAQLFEAQASGNPDRLAVASPSAQMSYGALNQKANQVAHYLKARGVGPEVLVGVCMQRSAEMIIGLLGVLKAGGAYVPLDPAYPAERLAFMLKDAGAPVLLTQRELLQALPETTAKVICLDNEENEIASQSADNLAPSVEPSNLAYVIYTSGSTGKPKGVAIEHRGLLNLIDWHQHTYEVSDKDRATQLAAQAFDASVWELWPYLTAGASIHIPDEETRNSPVALLEWLAEEKITLTFMATPLAEAVLELDQPKNLSLKALLTGGDRLHRAPQRELSFRLMNHYGPTENTVVATYCEVRPYEEGIPPIGRPIANTRTYILDESMQPVPVGVAGELYIGGESLARGYFQRPELTTEKFVPNPFTNEAVACLYKTGDLVRYRADGAIEFLGRMDDQVKIRGFRIELGEIAAALQEHDSVRQAVIVVRGEASGGKRLVAYVVPSTANMPSVSKLRNYLKNKLPDYMVPKAFVVMAKLPLTANGKLDQQALPEPEELSLTTHAGLTEILASPRTRTEEALVRIWAEVLNLPSVGIHDNFFELGGDSILSIQVVSRAAKTGINMTPKQIFRLQTIAELSQVVEPASDRFPTRDRPAGDVPLTPIQHWYFERDWKNRNAFFQSVLCSAEERVSDQYLEQAIRAVVSQHDSFRLRFTTDGKKWTQRYSEGPALAFSHHWAAASGTDVESAELVRICRKVTSALDIRNGPMFAGALVRFGSGGRKLFLAAHHLVVDAVSWRILLEDLNLACEQLVRGEKVELQPTTTSFQAWARLLQQQSSIIHSRTEADYWQRQLQATTALLPVDFSGENSLSSIEAVRVTFSEDETEHLRQSAIAHRSNLAEMLIAALVDSFAHELDGDFLVNIEGHGREELVDGIDLSRTVGWFTSIYPARFTPKSSFDGALREVKERLRSVPSRGTGYGVLRYLSSDPESKILLGRAPAEIGFNFLGESQATENGALIRPEQDEDLTGGTPSDHGTRPHKLDVLAGIARGKLLCSFVFSRNVHRRERIEGYARQFQRALQRIPDHSAPVLTTTDFRSARMGNEDLQKLLPRLSKSASQ